MPVQKVINFQLGFSLKVDREMRLLGRKGAPWPPSRLDTRERGIPHCPPSGSHTRTHGGPPSGCHTAQRRTPHLRLLPLSKDSQTSSGSFPFGATGVSPSLQQTQTQTRTPTHTRTRARAVGVKVEVTLKVKVKAMVKWK